MSRKFNLDEYEPVEERVKRFYADHPDGTIVTELKSDANNSTFAVFCATLRIAGEVVATGWAQEQREMEKKVSRGGQEYEDVNYTSWLENAETSAIGRALANFNYAGSKRPSREEMVKHERHAEVKPDNHSTTELAATLRKELDASRDIISADAWDKLDNGMMKHQGDESWFNRAIEGLRREVERQLALLEANAQATAKDPVKEAMSKLQAAAAKSERVAPAEVTQKELV
jgi:hypothetical protein